MELEFDRHEKYIPMNAALIQDVVWNIDRAVYLGDGIVKYPTGKESIHYLRTASKLAILMVYRPTLYYGLTGVSESELANIVRLAPTGNLVYTYDTPLRSFFDIPHGAKTVRGDILRNSTDINLYVFGSGFNDVSVNRLSG